MAEMVKVLYGDGVTEVTFGPELVFFRQESMLVTISHAAMREIMLSWERKEMRETD
jgi:hypothetical protein